MSNEPILSANPNESNSLSEAVQSALSKHQMNTDGMIPAIVESYDRKTNVATVRPVIMIVNTNNETKQRHALTQISVLSLGGGGFHISFPLKPGALGWIVAADRDISLFKQSLSESKPQFSRVSSFRDGLFIPDVLRTYAINEEDSESMVIQSISSNTRIAIGESTVNITATGTVKVDAPLTTFPKNVRVEGNMEVLGTSTFSAQTTIGDINVLNHGHEQNGDSGRTSGGMEE